MLSAAAVELLRAHALLAEHAQGLGYVEKLFKLLAGRLPPRALPSETLPGPPAEADDFGGSVLRLLHQLASSLPAAEALARTSPPAVPSLITAMR